ncbi:uncharacterized protein LOC142229184 [Haematobia irritans]|uniref:uncharacterized protein LOC142229184 n=1 Tax=Haematobia irritans TaxID=7368 RepID=UPI003F4F6981
MLMYADVIQIFLSSPVGDASECLGKLNHDLDRVFRWARANGLLLNPLKSKCLIIHKNRRFSLSNAAIMIDCEKIDIVTSAKNLGVVFNSTLSWSSHVNTVVGQTYAKLRTLWVNHSYTPVNIRLLLAKSLLIPGLIYGSELFANCDSRCIKDVEVRR